MPKAKKAAEGTLIKFMGDSDIRRLAAGETFNGEYPEGLANTLEWNVENGHVVDVTEPQEVIDLILGQPQDEFVDVTSAKKHPRNAWQDRWQPEGASGPDARNAVNALTATGVAVEGSGGSEATTAV